MDRYYCVFKMANTRPQHQTYEAGSVHLAIQKMMEIAQVTNTTEIDEAEILKCIRTDDGKPAYIKVFAKLKNETKGKIKLPPPPPATDVPAIEEQLDVYKKPYTIEVL